MGCDIHLIVQIKSGDGKKKWRYVPEIPEALDCRDYDTFAFLANVRGSYGDDGFMPKGIPVGLKGKKFRFVDHEQFVLDEYEKATVMMERKPDGTLIPCTDLNVDNWIKMPAKEAMTIDVFASKYHDYDTDPVTGHHGYYEVDFSDAYCHSWSYLTLDELKKKDKNAYFGYGIEIPEEFWDAFVSMGGKLPEGMEVSDTRTEYGGSVAVAWNGLEEWNKDKPVMQGIKELEEIAAKYGVGDADIRIVFGFDG